MSEKLEEIKGSIKKKTYGLLGKVISSLTNIQQKIGEDRLPEASESQTTNSNIKEQPTVKKQYIVRRRISYNKIRQQPTLAESKNNYPEEDLFVKKIELPEEKINNSENEAISEDNDQEKQVNKTSSEMDNDSLIKINNLRSGRTSDGTPLIKPSAGEEEVQPEQKPEVRLQYAPNNLMSAEDSANVTQFLIISSRITQKHAESDPIEALVNIPQPTYQSKETVQNQYDHLQKELFARIKDRMTTGDTSSPYYPRNLGKTLASYSVNAEGQYVHGKLSNGIKEFVNSSGNELLLDAYNKQLAKIVTNNR